MRFTLLKPQRKSGISTRNRKGCGHQSSRRMRVEQLEERTLLSVGEWDLASPTSVSDPSVLTTSAADGNPLLLDRNSQSTSPIISGEILVGFDGDVAALYRSNGAAAAMALASASVLSLELKQDARSIHDCLTRDSSYLNTLLAQLERLDELVVTGRLRVNVDCVFAFDDVRAAHDRLDGGHVTAKLVLGAR